MSGDPVEPSGSDRKPVGLLVRLAYATLADFRLRFAANLTRGGVFIRTRDPREVGTAVAFELRLSTDEKVLRGEGVVRWIDTEDLGATPPRFAGMGIQFSRLDAASRALVDAIATGNDARGTLTPPGRPRISTNPGLAGPVGTPVPVLTPAATAAQPPPTLTRPVTTPLPRRAPPAPEPATAATDAASASATATAASTSTSTGATSAGAPSAAPALAALDRPHRVEQLPAGAAVVVLPLPQAPEPITHPSRAVIGVDLGTTNSCAAVVRDGRPYLIPSREGYRTIPSIVALTTRHSLVVGHLARAQLLTNPAGTIHGAKRLMGRTFDSAVAAEMRGRFPYEIVADEDGMAAVRLGHLTLTLEQVAALILREVRGLAQDHLGEEVNRAVITVPAYYTERQRQAVRRAAGLAGLRVERILNEPTAAALAYAFGRHLQQRVLVYDLGGGTFDASVLELQDTIYEVVSTGGDNFLGGVDFDARITETLLQRYALQAGAEFGGDRAALSRLSDAAERAKCALSERSDFAVQLPYLALHDGKPIGLETTLTRAELERLVEPLVDRTIDVCRDVLLDRGLTVDDIDEVILVGGQSRMPMVHQKVSAFFGKAPSRAIHPDEAVALGAALLASSLESAEVVVLIDVLSRSIGVALPDGKVKTILPHNTSLPVRKQYGLSTSRDGQTEFELVVVQGESELAAECEYLGTLSLTGLPAGPRGMVKIAVTFELGAECLLTVTAREMHTQRQVSVRMSTVPGPAGARGRLAHGAGAGGTGLATGVHAAVTQDPAQAPADQVSGGDRLLGKLRRLFGSEG